jgi:hypothetical protein
MPGSETASTTYVRRFLIYAIVNEHQNAFDERMDNPDDPDAMSLHAAIARALQLADTQGETLIGAYLADVLVLAEKTNATST